MRHRASGSGDLGTSKLHRLDSGRDSCAFLFHIEFGHGNGNIWQEDYHLGTHCEIEPIRFLDDSNIRDLTYFCYTIRMSSRRKIK